MIENEKELIRWMNVMYNLLEKNGRVAYSALCEALEDYGFNQAASEVELDHLIDQYIEIDAEQMVSLL